MIILFKKTNLEPFFKNPLWNVCIWSGFWLNFGKEQYIERDEKSTNSESQPGCIDTQQCCLNPLKGFVKW